MSYLNYELIISPDAESDLEGIFLYGLQSLGLKRSRNYVAKLSKAINGLRNFPNIGSNHNEVFFGCKTIREGNHIIYYHVEGSVVFVDRVLHSRMDASKHINPPE